MLRIRLQRHGKQDQAHYSLVVQEHTSHVSKKYIDDLGWLNPFTKEKKIDLAKVEKWLANGAQPSSTVARLLGKEGVKNMDKFIERKKILTKAELAAQKKAAETTEEAAA